MLVLGGDAVALALDVIEAAHGHDYSSEAATVAALDKLGALDRVELLKVAALLAVLAASGRPDTIDTDVWLQEWRFYLAWRSETPVDRPAPPECEP